MHFAFASIQCMRTIRDVKETDLPNKQEGALQVYEEFLNSFDTDLLNLKKKHVNNLFSILKYNPETYDSLEFLTNLMKDTSIPNTEKSQFALLIDEKLRCTKCPNVVCFIVCF